MTTIARMRAEAEDLYGQKLGEIENTTNRIDGGFQRDDGASVKKVRISSSGGRRGVVDVGRPMKVFARK